MCRVFVATSEPNFIVVSHFKAMYSSMKLMLNTIPQCAYEIDDLSNFKLENYITLSIIRNPHERLLSLFFDKCKVDPMFQIQQVTSLRIQPSQLCIIAMLNEKSIIHDTVEPLINYSGDSFQGAIIKSYMLQLIELKFDVFIARLANCNFLKDSDEHFSSQYDNFNRFGIRTLDFLVNQDFISLHWDIFCKKLGRNLILKKENATNHGQVNEYYNQSSFDLIQKFYSNDFTLLKSLRGNGAASTITLN